MPLLLIPSLRARFARSGADMILRIRTCTRSRARASLGSPALELQRTGTAGYVPARAKKRDLAVLLDRLRQHGERADAEVLLRGLHGVAHPF